MTFDKVILGGRLFDGTGGPSALRNIGIRDGRVAAITADAVEGTETSTPAGAG